MNLILRFARQLARHKWLSLFVIIVVVAASYRVNSVLSNSRGQLTPPVSRGTIAETVYGIGTIVANQSLQIRPGQASHINRYFIKEGDIVARGAALLDLDGIIWRAPFRGTVTNLPFKAGENVFAQTPILTLTDLGDRYMVVSLEQQGALRVKPGLKVKMSFDAMRELSFDGHVQSVYSNENNFLARIDVSKLPARILPGMTADVAIVLATRDNVLLIPVAALDEKKLWVQRGGSRAVETAVETGVVDKDLAEIVKGDVREGDRLLIKGVVKK